MDWHRCTPIERWALLADLPCHPMQFGYRLDFRGRLDFPMLRRAVSHVSARHLLLHARIDDKGNIPHWVNDVHGIEPRQAKTTLPSYGLIDIRSGPGWGVSYLEKDTSCSLVIDFHHALCDGVGAKLVVLELLTAYRQLRSGQALPEERDKSGESAAELSRRWLSAGSMGSLRGNFLQSIHVVKKCSAFFFARPTPLGAPIASNRRGGYEFVTESLNGIDTHQEKAKSLGYSYNDLLLTTTAIACRKMLDRTADSPIRLIVPMDLREPHDTTIYNVCGFTHVTCRRHPTRSSDLAHHLHRQMKTIKQYRVGRALPIALDWACRGHLLPQVAQPNRSMATSIVSNVGYFAPSWMKPHEGEAEVDESVHLTSVAFAPPVDKFTPHTIGVVSFGNRTTFASATWKGGVHRENSRRLLQYVVEGIHQSAYLSSY